MTCRERTEAHRSWYTVVGVYTEDSQKFCDHVLAIDAQHAQKLVQDDPRIDDSLLIVAVFEGKLTAVDQGEIADPEYARFVRHILACAGW